MKATALIMVFALFGVLFIPQLVVADIYEVNILSGQGSEYRALEKGQYKKAIERLEHRIATEKSNLDIKLTNLCTAYVVTGMYDKAIATCDRAIDTNGEFVNVAYNSRGVLNAKLGDYVTALADFNQAQAASQKHHGAVRQFCAKCPGNRRFYEDGEEYDQSVSIAARNIFAADQMWANVQSKSSESE